MASEGNTRSGVLPGGRGDWRGCKPVCSPQALSAADHHADGDPGKTTMGPYSTALAWITATVTQQSDPSYDPRGLFGSLLQRCWMQGNDVCHL